MGKRVHRQIQKNSRLPTIKNFFLRTMRRLTREQIQNVKQILEDGKYKEKHNYHIQTKTEAIYDAFTTYCQYRNIGNKCWKIRYFRHNPRRLYSSRYDTKGGLYEDIPMSIYHIRLAVMYGIKKGEIEQVNQIDKNSHNRRVYRFTNNGDGR